MRWPLRRNGTLRRLNSFDTPAAIALLERDPVGSILARVPIEERYPRPSHAVGKFDDDGELVSLCWVGANIVPINFDDSGRDELANYLKKSDRYSNSVVGPADQVLPLWDLIKSYYPTPREIRSNQLSMVYSGGVGVSPDPAVRPARLGEGGIVVPASVAMFTEEVGYDPTIYGSGYAQRAHSLVRDGHTFVRVGEDAYGESRVEFKADVGALAGGVAQIQGVWVHPDLRGRGIATHAMVAVAEQVRETIAPTVSLYVNDFNSGAVRVYEKAGFDVVGTYATVLM